MSSPPTSTDTKTISSISGARGSPVFTPSPDDPYMLVRHAYSRTAPDTEFEPLEAPSETEEPQPLSSTSAPPSPDYTPASPNYTPATPHTNDESKPFETSETRVTSPHSTTPPTDSTSSLSPQRPLLTQTLPTPTPPRAFYYRSTSWVAVRTQPTLSPGYSAKLTEAMTLSRYSFRKRYISSYETPSSSSSLTFPVRKRYQVTFELIADTETKSDESQDEDIDSESKEATLEDYQQLMSWLRIQPRMGHWV
ncbi:hypothetical protein Tco_0992413 [Tanacetum coccineum]|uniref:Uncharacterized protein n=1 Tax=Tanacetum coccineum TaxID=301880 RepID=A0ABQ5F2H8_9ASTR